MEDITIAQDVSVQSFMNKAVISFMMKNHDEALFLSEWGRNGKLTIIDANALAYIILRFEQEELSGMNLFDVFAPESVHYAREKLLNVPVEGKEIWEAIVISKYRKRIQVEIKTYMFTTEDSIQLMLTMKDISSYKQEFVSEPKDYSKQALISTISNEIYAPMNRIVGYCQLFCQNDLPGETKADYIEYINKSCSHLHKLITDILDISRVEEEKVSMQKKQIFIPEFLNETLIAWKPEADKKNIDIILNLKDFQDDLIVISDESKLTKVIYNLIDNALRFTLVGYIEFGCLEKDSYLLFYVKDTGIGMSLAQYEMISELFDQSHENSGQHYNGEGLGLAISKYYINLLGGSIWIDTKHGEGSTFYFTIPYIKLKDSNDEFSVPQIDYSFANQKICLIVDNLEINYFYLKALLLPLGFKVIWAKDSDEAIYLSLIEQVDVVLMDLKIPDTDSFETTRIIRRKRPEIPIIALSVNAMTMDKDKAIQAGFDDVVTKPISKADFVKKMGLRYEFKK